MAKNRSEPVPGPFLGFQLKHIGDFLATLPALGFLKECAPGRPVGMVVTPDIAELARCHPWVDEVIELDRKAGRKHVSQVAQSIHDKYYGTAFIFDGQTRSIIAATLAGLRYRVGAPGLYPLGVRRPLYNLVVDIKDSRWPVESQAYRAQKMVAGALNLVPGPICKPPPLKLAAAPRAKAQSLIAELPGPGPLVGLSLRGRQLEKTWPLMNFIKVAQRLWNTHQARLFVTGGPEDSALARNLAIASEVPVADFCGRTNLPELAALTEMSDLIISVDTGTAHIAALTDTPIISIFVWTSPALWAPQSEEVYPLAYDWALKRFGLISEAEMPWLSAPVISPAIVYKEASAILRRRRRQL